MATRYGYLALAILAILAIVALLRRPGALQKGIVSPERRRQLAEQYKAQMDGIFNQAARERRKLTAAEEQQVNLLQEKLIQLGYIYELPANYQNGDHVFTPASLRFQTYLN